MSHNRRNRGRRRGPPPRGFTGPGFGELYRVVLPMRGAEKRRLFNAMGRWALAGAGAACGALGYGAAGPLGAAVGLGMGLLAGARYLVRNRFHRG
jgi:hypothetical protein